MYTVTRQRQWPEGQPVVEISEGGLDYTNPGALVKEYAGEFETFASPVEAVEIAIEICKQWRKDREVDATIGVGCTGGYTMPFESCSFDEAIAWAKKIYEQLEKCPACGDIVEDLTEWYQAGWYSACDFVPYDNGEKYCSEHCAEKNSQFDEAKEA